VRYYSIEISDADSGAAVATYTSFPNGQTDPNALNVEFDLPVAANAQPTGDANTFVRIWGIPLTDIAQSRDLNGKSIKVYGGMQKGLPLANPAQAGLLVQGVINQAFGNWIGTDMTLDLQIYPGTGTQEKPKNLVMNWQKGQQLSASLQSTLQTAFPGYTINMNISDKVVATMDDPRHWDTVPQMALDLYNTSKKIIGGDKYSGVEIFVQDKTIAVYDNTHQPSPIQIDFTDLIGQVTWLDFATLQVSCVMRAKPGVGDIIKLPPGQVTINAASLSQFRQGSVFQGTFMINAVRHVGNFRQAASQSWMTTYEVVQWDTIS
jgi:hypothetical protein